MEAATGIVHVAARMHHANEEAAEEQKARNKEWASYMRDMLNKIDPAPEEVIANSFELVCGTQKSEQRSFLAEIASRHMPQDCGV